MAMPNPLPANWSEIINRPEEMQNLQGALALLQNTFVVGQYDRLSIRQLTKKMIPRFNKPGEYLLSLRVFVHTVPPDTVPDIATFFFLRKRVAPLAYCVTVGALPLAALPPANVKQQLFNICQYMSAEPGGEVLDVVTDLDPATDDAPPCDNLHGNVSQVFSDLIASAQPPRLIDRGQINVGNPWPDRVHRWELRLQ